MITIYVTEPGSYITVQNDHLLVFHQEQLYYKVFIPQVSQIVIFGKSTVKSEAASLALFRRIPILFLNNHGESLSSLEYKWQREPKYLPQQKDRADDQEFAEATAESVIRAKLHNCCVLLLQSTPNYSPPAVQIALDVILLLIDDLSMADSIDELQEYEMMAATFYYAALAALLPSELNFEQRTHGWATDPVNRLLNLGYALLHQQIYTFVKTWGLHPDWANLHQSIYYDSPLVWDLMAEFRAPLVDELVLDLVNSHILTLEDFTIQEHGRVYLYPEGLRTFIQYWEDKLRAQIVHPHAGKVTGRRCLELQVRSYIACLLKDVDFYRPMHVKLNATPLPVYPSVEQETESLVLTKV
ncbi:MAG: CRISPR-associated endonuclease Cas1 [Nostocaceae cyanobacterium]|nr:CRISPR-associated endonuclease Cas1 [Nostocaceae cyanobacterium]